MSRPLRLGMIQIRVDDDPQTNLDQVLKGMETAARQKADLVLLPELWNTPFINESIRRHSGEWEQLMAPVCKKAKELGLWTAAGTLPCRKGDRVFNRCALISSRGEIVHTTDKLHLLEVHTSRSEYMESDVLDPGTSISLAETPWGKIAIAVCFDIRFPELIRLLAKQCSLLLLPAGFNASIGKKHWLPLLKARAIENEIFVCGVNPQARQYDGYSSWAHSLLIGPDGECIACMEDNELVRTVEIDLDEAEKIRSRSPYWSCRRLDLYELKEKIK